jgi:hypothetical protein
MKKFAKLLTLGLVTTLVASGCATVSKGTRQAVEITSAPAGATVTVNGNPVGTTPLTVRLSRQQAHEISIERAGYYSEQVFLRTVPNEAADAFIRFGIDQTLGAHNDLTPSEIRAELDPLILPDSVGGDPVGELAAKVVEVDELLYTRQIDADEHRYLLSRLLRFYSQQQ